MTWRDVLPVHPAAELLPMGTDAELDELGANIKEHGLRHGIVFWTSDRYSDDFFLLDGRRRLEAMERAGVPFVYVAEDGCEPLFYPEAGGGTSSGCEVGGDPYEAVLSLNVHRRHLNAEAKRKIVADVLKAQTELSDRRIAKAAKVDHKTVGKQRAKLEATGEIPQSTTRTGADGKARKQPAKKRARPNWAEYERRRRRGVARAPAEKAIHEGTRLPPKVEQPQLDDEEVDEELEQRRRARKDREHEIAQALGETDVPTVGFDRFDYEIQRVLDLLQDIKVDIISFNPSDVQREKLHIAHDLIRDVIAEDERALRSAREVTAATEPEPDQTDPETPARIQRARRRARKLGLKIEKENNPYVCFSIYGVKDDQGEGLFGAHGRSALAKVEDFLDHYEPAPEPNETGEQ
jgi:ParB/Sulfiredoxin domain